MRADRVMELRKLLDKLGDVTGLMGEEKGKFVGCFKPWATLLRKHCFLSIFSYVSQCGQTRKTAKICCFQKNEIFPCP